MPSCDVLCERLRAQTETLPDRMNDSTIKSPSKNNTTKLS
ncbi:hypothetical protein TELCIR_24918 [Teladorsagia circumcincta]|uniref:Uncharacterized protein n=1 Tax=Teladorsagia circumcincta TaxID=45464 RepID=A0A2G9T6X4_TELCI|nr:hypothetical protein TELCIR_24918 [Teladorsagia circumcincta]